MKNINTEKSFHTWEKQQDKIVLEEQKKSFENKIVPE